jgi:hypothetical protein
MPGVGPPKFSSSGFPVTVRVELENEPLRKNDAAS